MATRSLIIDVVINAGDASRKLAGVAGGVRSTGEAARTAGPALGGMARSLASAAAGAVAFQQVANFARESIGLFARQADAINTLNTALQNQGGDVVALSGQYQALASELQSLTTVGDEAILEVQALLTQIGNVAPEQMRAATMAVLDLSEGMGKGLRESAVAVAKAFVGKTEVLAELGIELDRTTGAMDLGSQAVDALTERFGGQAQAAAQTYSGQVEQLGNAWGDLKEQVGAVLVPLVQQLLPAISRGIELFMGLSPQVRTAIVVVGGLSAAILALSPVVAAIALSIGALATGPIAAVVAAVVGLTATWVAWGDDITRIVGQTVTGVRDWLVGRLGAIFDAVGEKVEAVKGFFRGMFEAVVGGSFVPDLVNGIEMHFARLSTVMVEPARTALDQVTGVFQGWADNLGGMMGGLFGAGGLLSGIITGGMSTIMSSLGGLVTSGLGKIGGAFKRLFGGPSAKELAGREIVENFQGNIAQMLTEQQQIAAGGELWKQVNIGVGDAYIQAGLSAEEAARDVGNLYDKVKEGPTAVIPIIDMIRAKMEGVRSAAQGAASAVRSIGSAAASVRVPSVSSSIPQMAEGGIVRRPTLAMIGERGPEAVVPLSRSGPLGGLNLTINVNGGLFSDRQSIGHLADRINRETVRQMQRRRQL